MGQHEQRSRHRRDPKILGGLLLGLVLLAVGVAGAQQSDADAEPPVPAAPAPSSLTPGQMLEQSRNTLERMQMSADSIRRQLAEAREARDVVKSLCLDDKLSQMDVARRSAGDRVSGLESAVSSGNAERARHEFAVITALQERMEALTAEASQCIGEETGAIGDATLSVTVDAEIAAMEPTIPLDPLVSAPPVLASPTL
jgi:hypothetical protein